VSYRQRQPQGGPGAKITAKLVAFPMRRRMLFHLSSSPPVLPRVARSIRCEMAPSVNAPRLAKPSSRPPEKRICRIGHHTACSCGLAVASRLGPRRIICDHTRRRRLRARCRRFTKPRATARHWRAADETPRRGRPATRRRPRLLPYSATSSRARRPSTAARRLNQGDSEEPGLSTCAPPRARRHAMRWR